MDVPGWLSPPSSPSRQVNRRLALYVQRRVLKIVDLEILETTKVLSQHKFFLTQKYSIITFPSRVVLESKFCLVITFARENRSRIDFESKNDSK